MLFEKDNTETINVVADNLSGFFKDLVSFVEELINFFKNIKLTND